MNFLTAFLLMVVLSQEKPLVQKLPDGVGAWTLDLITAGGFDGMGIGKYAVNSSGMLSCTSTKHKCPNKLSATALKSLTEQVRAAAGVPWEMPTQPGVCSDCVTVRLQLTMRQSDGSIKTFITS